MAWQTFGNREIRFRKRDVAQKHNFAFLYLTVISFFWCATAILISILQLYFRGVVVLFLISSPKKYHCGVWISIIGLHPYTK